VISPSQHQPYQLLPPLSPNEFAALKDDIAMHGIRVPVIVDEDGEIIDGHHRYTAAVELGLRLSEIPVEIRSGLSEMEKRQLSRSMNMQRRHLSSKQKRQLIISELEEDHLQSNNSIALRLGVSDVTVGAIRRKLGLTSDVRVGVDGVAQRVGLKAEDQHKKLIRQFAITVYCDDEEQQGQLLTKLSDAGFRCRALIS
jgi:ParB-like chromosome segregation protein Spo0J